MASLRNERRIAAPADVVWNVVRRPESIPDWFPGIVSCHVEGNRRTITTAIGLEMPEEILACDDSLRHFAYRILAPVYKFHLGTIDVIDLGPRDSLCIYSTTAEPDALALVISGATVDALREIERIVLQAAKE
ncbi:MAG TPA: SRPBCC family protein [Acidimicrobiales bacterium]|nr:SRPBCC family protein [Acidimicrobiales bacterium]